MLCDLDTINGILVGANTLIVAAIVLCGIAIGLNLNIFTFWSAPVAFGLALTSGLTAELALLPVTQMLASCSGSAGQCGQIARDAATGFGVAAGFLAAGIGASYLAIATSAVPVAGAFTMAVYATGLAIASAFLFKAILILRELQACLNVPAPSTSTAVVLTGGAAVALSAILIFAFFFAPGFNGSKKGG